MASIAPDKMLGDLVTIDALIDKLLTERKKLVNQEPNARERMIETARKLTLSLETPLESILWMIWAEPTKLFASRIALDLEIFKTLVKGGGTPKTIDELAEPTRASPVLVNRIARKLATNQLIEQRSPGVYAANSLTHVLSNSKYSEGIRFCYDSTGPSFVQMAEYFEMHGYSNPSDPLNGPFQFSQKSESVPAWFGTHPKAMSAFYAYSQGKAEGQLFWTDTGFYPVKDRLFRGLNTSGQASTFVDVAGGMGQGLTEFLARYPDWPGDLVLQELPDVIERTRESGIGTRIQLQTYDFFTEQPIKGARAYFMRWILHDWDDESCLRILTHLKEAMQPGYSRVLIHDCVLADKEAVWQHVSLDLYMMALTSSYERTESEWRQLIASAGLTIGGIYSKGQGNESIIEVLLES